MKKVIAASAALIVVDQVLKWVIAYFFMEADVVIIPRVLYFHPIQNTNLTWVASLMGYRPPAALVVCTQAAALAVVLLIYRYCVYMMGTHRRYLNIFLLFAAAAISCAFIDVAFWGGSLDYIRLFHWFTFDLKDVYINLFIAFLFLFFGAYSIKYSRLNQEERKEERIRTGMWRWLKNGCPMRP